MTTADDLHHLAGAYALDAVSSEERRAFEAHYPTCEICSAELRDFRETAAELGVGVLAEPPPAMRGRVLSEISRTRQLSPLLPGGVVDLAEQRRRRRPNRPIVLAAAAAAIVVFVGVVGALQLRSADPTIEDVVAAPDAIATVLDGESGSVTVVWSASDDRVAVIGTDLVDPGPGREYALWFLVDDGVSPAGLFAPENGLVGQVLTVADLSAEGWGVTIEPEGGSPQPTGEVLYAGRI